MIIAFFFSSRRRHTRWPRDWSSDVCSSDLRRRRCEPFRIRGRAPPRGPDGPCRRVGGPDRRRRGDRKSTRLNSSHVASSYAVFCLKKKNVEETGKMREKDI